MIACQSKQSCLFERERAMRLPYYQAWVSPCADCPEGMARQMDDWTPEPGWGPCCIACGHPRGDKRRGATRQLDGKLHTTTGLCQECSCKARDAKTRRGNTSNHAFKAFFGYKAKGHKIMLHIKAKKDAA